MNWINENGQNQLILRNTIMSNIHPRLHTVQGDATSFLMCQQCGKRYVETDSLIFPGRLLTVGDTATPLFLCQECRKAFPATTTVTLTPIAMTATQNSSSPITNKLPQPPPQTVQLAINNNNAQTASTPTPPATLPTVPKLEPASDIKPLDMNTTSNSKPYECQQCGKTFIQRYSYICHARIHSGETPFVCQDCGRGFTRKNYLTVHSRIHRGEKPFSCQQCGKGFTRRDSLICHSRIHTGEKPFVCQQCGKAFIVRHHLISHTRTHTGEKPYTCPHCGKGFARRDSLVRHSKTHTIKTENPTIPSVMGKNSPFPQ